MSLVSSSSSCPKHPSLASVGACAFCLKERLDLLADAEMPVPVWPSFSIHEAPPDPCSHLDFDGRASSAQSLGSDRALHSANSSVTVLRRTQNRGGRMPEICHSHQLCSASSNSGISVPTNAVHNGSSRSILDARRTLSGLETSAYRSAISSMDNCDMVPSSDVCPVNRRNSLSFLLSIDDCDDRSAVKLKASQSGALTDKQSSAAGGQRRCKYLGSLSDRFGLSSSDALLCGANEEKSTSSLSSVKLGGRKSSAWQPRGREDYGWQQRCREYYTPAGQSRHCCHACEDCKQTWQASRPSSWEGLWLAEPPKCSLSHDPASVKASGRGSFFSRADILCHGSLSSTDMVCNGNHGPKLSSQHCPDTVHHQRNCKNGRSTYCFGDETSKVKRSDEDSFFIRSNLCIGEGGSQRMIHHDLKKCRGVEGGGMHAYGEDERSKVKAFVEGEPFFQKFGSRSRHWQEVEYDSKKIGEDELGDSIRYTGRENEASKTFFARRMLQDACTQTTPSRSSDAESHEDKRLSCHDHQHSTTYGIDATSSAPTLWHKLWSKTSKWASRHSKH